MRREFLELMKERYNDLLISAKFNYMVYNEISKVKKKDNVKKLCDLYLECEKRGSTDLKDEYAILHKTLNSFCTDISDVKESDTNQIYFLTRRNVYQINFAKAGFIYDSSISSRYNSPYDNMLGHKYGDIFMNIENDKFWRFVSKEEQPMFIKNNMVIMPDDCSLYYLAHKDFYETAIKDGEEAAIKKVLSKRY